MSVNRDVILLESTTAHRQRLRGAFLFGELDDRRTVSDNVKRLVGSVILAAVICVICIGVSFVGNLLAEQAAAKEAQLQEQQQQLEQINGQEP